MSALFSLNLIKLIQFCLIIQILETRSVRRDGRVTDVIDYSGSQVIRVVPTNRRQIEYLVSLERDPRVKIWLRATHLGAPVDIMVHNSQLRQLEEELEDMGLMTETFINDVGGKIERNNLRYFSTNGAEDSFFDDFRRYTQIQNFLNEKRKQNPELVSITSIGRSVEGRPIACIKIGVGLGSSQKPVIYIDGGMHAREWAAVSTALYIIDHLIDDYKSGDSSAQYLLKKFDFFIVPVVNPDGYEYTHTNDRMWRKNRAKIAGSQCMGTDLNRNYPFHWGGEGSSHEPCDETFAGVSALSEPESTAVTKLILSNKHRMMAYITLHAYGQYFLYPWGWTKDDSPNAKELKRVADIGYRALYSVHKTKYQVGSPGQIMYVSQGSDDWAHGGAQIPYVYCLEMRDLGEHGFLLPKSEIVPVGEETYAAVKAIAKTIANTKRNPNSNISTRIGKAK